MYLNLYNLSDRENRYYNYSTNIIAFNSKYTEFTWDLLQHSIIIYCILSVNISRI